MREKLEKAWIKVGKFLFWALVTALCCCLTYMVFVHRRVIIAAIKGEPLPEPRRVSVATNSARRNNEERTAWNTILKNAKPC